MDVHQSAGQQHALSYTTPQFLAAMIHRRLLVHGALSGAAVVVPLFALAHGELTIRLLAGGIFRVGWLLAPVIESLLWPVVSILLLVPQRARLTVTRTDHS
jgi:rod shape-determining protein MreD